MFFIFISFLIWTCKYKSLLAWLYFIIAYQVLPAKIGLGWKNFARVKRTSLLRHRVKIVSLIFAKNWHCLTRNYQNMTFPQNKKKKFWKFLIHPVSKLVQHYHHNYYYRRTAVFSTLSTWQTNKQVAQNVVW